VKINGLKFGIELLVIGLTLSCSSLEKKAKDCLELGDYERAINLYNEMVDQSPKKFEGRYGLGLAFYQKAYALQERGVESRKQWQKSIEEMQFASRIGTVPSLPLNLANAHYRLAVVLDDQGESAQAKRNLEEVLRLNPSHTKALHRLGTLYLEAKEYQKARSTLQGVLELDPTFLSAYKNLGIALWAIGKIKEAAEIWEAGLTMEPNDSFLMEWSAKANKRL